LESIKEWSDYMKTPGTWNFRSIAGKVMLGLVLAAMTGSIDVAPSYGDDGHKRGDRYEHGGRGHDNGRYEKRGHGHDRDRYYYRNGRRHYRQTVYRETVYVAPPVVYAPPEPPGISIFFPPIIIR
jgi:hypothetical protein